MGCGVSGGEFRQTGKLPTEDQLIEEYQTTRYRVRNAIAVLAEAGDVFPVRGSGVFVREDRRRKADDDVQDHPA